MTLAALDDDTVDWLKRTALNTDDKISPNEEEEEEEEKTSTLRREGN